MKKTSLLTLALLSMTALAACGGGSSAALTITYVGETSYAKTTETVGGSATFELPFTLSRELANDEKMDEVRYVSFKMHDAESKGSSFIVNGTSLILKQTIKLTAGQSEGSCAFEYEVDVLKSSGETFVSYETVEIALSITVA